MKWAIVGLTVLGLAAAACAALLVSAIRTGSLIPDRSARADGEVRVLYAKQAMPAMMVVEGHMVDSKTMPRSQAPANSISDPVQVVGRVLTVPLVEGQAFTNTSFIGENSASVAAAVGKGKRAVGISVTDYGGLEGLLYPGSVVDVLVSLKRDQSGMSNPGVLSQGALATTLLERVQVLAIERQTVVSGSSNGKVGADVENTMRPGSQRRVTLLVSTKEAKILQLAMEQGTLSLAMRNPLDTDSGDKDQISLRSILGDLAEDPSAAPVDNKPPAWERALALLAKAAAAAPRGPKPSDDPFAAGPPPAARWETTVIRGDKSQTYSFPVDEGPGKDAPVAAENASDPQTGEQNEKPDGDGSKKEQPAETEPAAADAARAADASPRSVTQ